MTARKDIQHSSAESPESGVHVITGATQFVVVQRRPLWQPPTDVIEFEDHIMVVIELAGMRPEAIHVSVMNQRLVVSGERMPAEMVRGRAAYHQLEVRYGLFRSEVLLPWAVDEENIHASYLDGLLTIDMPRPRDRRAKVIEVTR